MSDKELLKQCTDLQKFLTVGEKSDIEGYELCEELKILITAHEDNDDIISALKSKNRE